MKTVNGKAVRITTRVATPSVSGFMTVTESVRLLIFTVAALEHLERKLKAARGKIAKKLAKRRTPR